MRRSLSVWWDDTLVGTLTLNATGRMNFSYQPAWLKNSTAPALSVSLPKREQRFPERECRPFFGGLLPEEGQLDAVAAYLAVSRTNTFSLLDALGGEVAGALTLWPTGEKPPNLPSTEPPRPLSDEELSAILKQLPTSPLLADRKELRLSLAGAQPKIPVVLIGNRVALSLPGQPTTHIVKPALSRFDATTENEALVMTLAAEIGLDVAPVEARTASGQAYLLVTRYDRVISAERVQRLHQEDFCQALGIPPEGKYEAEGGPTFATSFELVRTACTQPAVEVLKLLDAAIFNLVVGNSDAHGKNFSLLYVGNELRLAPLYDLLSTAAYPELSSRLAMKLGKRAELSEMGVKTWPTFAAAAGIGTPYTVRRVRLIADAVSESVGRVADRIKPGFDHAALDRYVALIQRRASRVRETASQATD